MTTLRIGREQFYEGLSVNRDGESLTISSQESSPPLSAAQIELRKENLVAMIGQTVPIVFGRKDEYNGYYRINNAGVEYINFDGQVLVAGWEVDATPLGSHSEVEVESALYAIDRANAHSVSPVRWHAAASGALAYTAGVAEPSLLVRPGDDGDVPVYLNVSGSAARWTVTPDNYYRGAATALRNGLVLSGTNHSLPADSWEISNGVVRVYGDSGASLNVEGFFAGQWRSGYSLLVRAGGSMPTTGWAAASVIVNSPEQVTVRLTRPAPSGVGRLTLDLTIRRGARFVHAVFQSHTAMALGVETGTAATSLTNGFIQRSTNDADGNRWVLGSAQSISGTAASGRITANSTRQLAFYTGVVSGSAGSGESALNNVQQYMGTPSVRERIVKR